MHTLFELLLKQLKLKIPKFPFLPNTQQIIALVIYRLPAVAMLYE